MNKYENLNIHDYEDKYELADLMYTLVGKMDDESEYGSVAVYGKSEFIWDMFEIFAYEYDAKIGALDIDRYYFDDCYGAEYCLRIFDDEMMIVEPARMDSGELHYIDDIAFIYQEDCEQDMIDEALDDKAVVILFGFEDDEDEDDCDGCCEFCNRFEDKHGVKAVDKEEKKPETATTISYKINGREVDKETYIKAVEKMDEEFIDVFYDALIAKCEIMDKFNDLLSRFW